MCVTTHHEGMAGVVKVATGRRAIGSTAALMSGGQLTLPNLLSVLRMPEGALLQRSVSLGRLGVQAGTAAHLRAYAHRVP